MNEHNTRWHSRETGEAVFSSQMFHRLRRTQPSVRGTRGVTEVGDTSNLWIGMNGPVAGAPAFLPFATRWSGDEW